MYVFAFFFFPLILASWSCQSQSDDVFKDRRYQMVRRQIAARGITNHRVLDAMRKVERHLFVPGNMAAYAYDDRPLNIGYSQTISQPYIVAFMTEAIDQPGVKKVLEIGTGSGYQAAILAELFDSVFTVEIIPALGQQAKKLLAVLGYNNIQVKIADGYQGWQKHSPYQAILVTCSPTHVPEPLVAQLDEGGRMIIPVGKRDSQELVILTKKDGRLKETAVLPVLFVPMIDKNNSEY
jgi:protein-L-isoaspartate(D-aspartate) O-methyltransferase